MTWKNIQTLHCITPTMMNGERVPTVVPSSIPYGINPKSALNSNLVRAALVTCGVNIEVRGFVGHVPAQLQPRPAGLDPARVAQRLRDVHHEGTPLDVLPRKQNLDLDTQTQSSMLTKVSHL